jgi:hypothetical protein
LSGKKMESTTTENMRRLLVPTSRHVELDRTCDVQAMPHRF